MSPSIWFLFHPNAFYSLKGPFNTYLTYFTFIKSVAINKDLSQIMAKGVRIS